jgi:two-component system sensor histidine kinase KdpD
VLEANEIEDLLGAMLQRVSGAAGAREIRITLDPQHPLLFARCDFTQTLRVLSNVMENALKYSPASPIDVRACRDGEWIAITIGDGGIGIPEAERARIFEPFYRRASLPPDVGGAGLGLSIARGLAEAQGGTLDYAPRDGGGSAFTLRLHAVDVTGDD